MTQLSSCKHSFFWKSAFSCKTRCADQQNWADLPDKRTWRDSGLKVSSLISSHLSREKLLVVSDEPVSKFLQPYIGPELAQGRPLACFIFHVSICQTCTIISRLIMGCVEARRITACQPYPPGEKFLMKLRWRTSLQSSHASHGPWPWSMRHPVQSSGFETLSDHDCHRKDIYSFPCRQRLPKDYKHRIPA